MPGLSAYPAASGITTDDIFIGLDGSTTKRFPASVVSSHLGGLVNVKRFGVVADGSTNDTAGWVTALASGESLFLPPGISMVDPDSLEINFDGQRLEGAGRELSLLKLRSGGVLLDISGTNDTFGGHRRYNALSHLTFDGNDQTGTLLRCYHGDNLNVSAVAFQYHNGRAIDHADWWDSAYNDLVFDWCGKLDATEPVVHLRNSAAASGFGYTANAGINMLRFRGCRWESFRAPALKVEAGTNNLSDPHGIYVEQCKMESYRVRANFIELSAQVKHFHLDGLYLAAMAFDDTGTAYSTPVIGIYLAQAGHASVRNVLITHAATAILYDGIQCYSGSAGPVVIENVTGYYGTAPGRATVRIEGGTTELKLGTVTANLGTPVSLNTSMPTSPMNGEWSRGYQAPAYAASFTPSIGGAPIVKIGALTGNITIAAPTNIMPGQEFTIITTQDATGGRTHAWNAVYKGPNVAGPTAATTTASKMNSWSFVWDGTQAIEIGSRQGLG